MSVIEPGSVRANLLERVKNILMSPGPTWDVIDAEPASVQGLYTGYVAILAAIGPVCSFVHNLVFGTGFMFVSVHLSPVWLATQLVISYAISLAMVFVFALIIEALAPNFGGVKDRTQAMKVAAYAPTAGWVAGVFLLLPFTSILALVGFYSLYLLWVGLPKLMKVPQERAPGYFLVVLLAGIVVGIVVSVIFGSLSAMAMGSPFGGPFAGASHVASAKVTVPGLGTVDADKLQQQANRMEAAAKQMQNGQGPAATDPEVLKTYLPASVAGYARSELSASSGGAGGMNGSSAEGSYAKGDARIRLTVTDMGGLGALAGMANAFNVHSTKETGSGYEKVGKVNGRMTQESYDRQSKHGEYGVMVGDRFMVQAEGDGVSIDELKAAVDAVPAARLEGLAKAG